MSWRNPLNTTQDWPGAVAMNSAGVKRYRTIQDGIDATVTTLKNGHYPAILDNLKASRPRANWGNACPNLSTWGTGCTWLRVDYGPPPTNLEGDEMTPQEAAQAKDTNDKVTEVWDLLRTGTHAPQNPNWIRAELEGIKTQIAGIKTAGGGLTDAQAGQLAAILQILTRMENALKSA
jgi:hypothetical protein